MSAHPSPGPSHNQSHNSHPHQKKHHKQFAFGITAGAEDVKYQAKYKDLKRKVKEIEADNDKLFFKVLQAKRSIQRMKLERAILYERLSHVPPSPEVRDRQPLPQIQPAPGVPPPPPPPARLPSSGHQHRQIREHPSAEPDPALVDYIRTHGNPRVAPGPDGRPVPVIDSPMAPAGAPPPPSHSSAMNSPRRTPSAHESVRHLPPMQTQPPGQQYEPRTHSHSQASPPMHHAHSHSSSSHELHDRSKPPSRSRSHHVSSMPYSSGHNHHHHQYAEIPSSQHVMHSPPLPERERSRRHDVHELSSSRSEHHSHGHHEHLSHLSPRALSSDVRSSGRHHSHHRPAHGTYTNDDHERQRDFDRERDWEYERGHGRDLSRSREVTSSHTHSPRIAHHSRQPITMERPEYHERHSASHYPEEQSYYRDPPTASGYSLLSRSVSPGSVSGDGPSQPDSRHFYDDRARSSYRLRPVTQQSEEIDFVHEDGRSHSRDRGSGGGGNYQDSERSYPTMGSRKRNRNDMDVDSENDVAEGHSGGPHYATGRIQEDRGSKRYREHTRRSTDNHEDSRIGPS